MNLTAMILGWLFPCYSAPVTDSQRKAEEMLTRLESHRKQTVEEIVGMAALETEFGTMLDHRGRRGMAR